MTDTNPFEAIRARLAEGRLWQKGSIGLVHIESGSVCLAGAAQSAIVHRYVPHGFVEWGGYWLNYANAMCVLKEVVTEQFGDRAGGSVANFNDHPDTTWADIELVLDKCAQKWDEQHG